jgi:RNA polymerase sigma-70 factor, ECF subfamily
VRRASFRELTKWCYLESTLEILCNRGHAAHRDLALDRDRFAAHLTRCGAPLAAGPEAIHAEDLYLACAALDGNELAIAKIRHACRPAIVRYLAAIDRSEAFVAEFEQGAWEVLLVGRDGEAPKLATYSGRGALAGFVGVTAQRIALTSLRHQAVEGQARVGAAAAAVPSIEDPELAFLKGKHQEDFQSAVRESLGVLDDRERMIYRMHVVDGLSVDRIAAVYRVSQSTISRWMAKARATVIGEARRLLRERVDLADSEFQLVIGLMISQLDVSVSQVLRGQPA